MIWMWDQPMQKAYVSETFGVNSAFEVGRKNVIILEALLTICCYK
jgi:hypothetical protein